MGVCGCNSSASDSLCIWKVWACPSQQGFMLLTTDCSDYMCQHNGPCVCLARKACLTSCSRIPQCVPLPLVCVSAPELHPDSSGRGCLTCSSSGLGSVGPAQRAALEVKVQQPLNHVTGAGKMHLMLGAYSSAPAVFKHPSVLSSTQYSI